MRITVPPLPELKLTPKSATALVTAVVGEEAKKCFAVSEPYMRAYAARVGADFVVLDWPGHKLWPMSSKFAIAKTLDYYDRILYVDADVLLRPGCVNLFDVCPSDHFGIVNEMKYHENNPKYKRVQEYQQFRKEMGFGANSPILFMGNAGVMVIPKSHQKTVSPPSGEITIGHCAEQDHTNAQLIASGLPYTLLERKCNYQYWTDKNLSRAPSDAVLHWSGAPKSIRSKQMREWADRYPVDLTVAPTTDKRDYKKQLLIESQVTSFPHFGSGAGDGIVYVGGGKYWPMIVAGIRVLRDTGCTLPVEVWYRGKCEEVDADDTFGLNVRLCDIDRMASVFGDSRISTGLVCKGGWEAKLYAIYHTNFDRIIFLDADAYAINDPTSLFKHLDNSAFVYWKDLPQQANSVKWNNVYPEGAGKSVPPVQGGQLIIDRIKAQRLIHTANWMCQHSEYFFKQMYGDQDTWRVGLTMGLAEFKCLGAAGWTQGIAFDCRDSGTQYILHRCQGKLFEPKYTPKNKPKYNVPRYALPREADYFAYFNAVVASKEPIAAEVFSKTPERKSGHYALKEARPYLDTMNRLIREHGWKSVTDLGCGDSLIGSKLDIAEYIGVECVPLLVEQCTKAYPKNKYLELDFSENYDIIPVADCIVLKDVLQQWPNDKIKSLFTFLIESNKCKAIVICQDNNQTTNAQDCFLGGHRPLNFGMEPLAGYLFDQTINFRNKTLGLINVESRRQQAKRNHESQDRTRQSHA